MINYEAFQKSLRHLILQFENYQHLNERRLSNLDQEAIQESVIQRFETCYNTAWKHLKRYLAEEEGIIEIPNSPKGVFRLAHENQLLPNIDRWFRYADAQVATAHDYSSKKAQICLILMTEFIEDAIQLYQKITGENWTL